MYILIVIILGTGSATGSVEFSTKAKCEAAVTQIEKSMAGFNANEYKRAFCTKK